MEDNHQKLEIDIKCQECGTSHIFMVNSKDYIKYIAGKLSIQTCFPYLTSAERELIISHICGECFDKLFDEEEFK
jgi:hypothetical protein